jgi:hypothetical protein
MEQKWDSIQLAPKLLVRLVSLEQGLVQVLATQRVPKKYFHRQ